MKGAAVEEEFRKILSEYLPDNIAIGTGVIIDAFGGCSKQIDIVCYDRARTPTFFSAGGAGVFPVECVYFAIEVKTSITPADLQAIYENMISVKSLSPSAYYGESHPIKTTFSFWGREYPHWKLSYAVLALEGPGSKSFEDKLLDLRDQSASTEMNIDCLFVLGDGTYCNVELQSGGQAILDFLPTPKTILVRHLDNPLMMFFGLFSRYYNQADIGGRFDFTKYLTHGNKYTVLGIDRPSVRKLIPGN